MGYDYDDVEFEISFIGMNRLIVGGDMPGPNSEVQLAHHLR